MTAIERKWKKRWINLLKASIVVVALILFDVQLVAIYIKKDDVYIEIPETIVYTTVIIVGAIGPTPRYKKPENDQLEGNMEMERSYEAIS